MTFWCFSGFVLIVNHLQQKAPAYLIDEELQLQDSSSALVLAVAVHSGSAQSDCITRSRKSVLSRQSGKSFAHGTGGEEQKLPFI